VVYETRYKVPPHRKGDPEFIDRNEYLARQKMAEKLTQLLKPQQPYMVRVDRASWVEEESRFEGSQLVEKVLVVSQTVEVTECATMNTVVRPEPDLTQVATFRLFPSALDELKRRAKSRIKRLFGGGS